MAKPEEQEEVKAAEEKVKVAEAWAAAKEKARTRTQEAAKKTPLDKAGK